LISAEGRITTHLKAQNPAQTDIEKGYPFSQEFLKLNFQGGRVVILAHDIEKHEIIINANHPQAQAVYNAIFEQIGAFLNSQRTATKINFEGNIVENNAFIPLGALFITPDFGPNKKLADYAHEHTPQVLGVNVSVGGGGGKGMRIVHSEDKLEENIKIAQTEAKKFFNNDEVFIEKFFENPRHIEVQILSDGKDNTVHLGERDCSVQRRYQKIIEESPCPVINDEQRKYLLDVSVNAISKLGYEGAGTLEFIYDKGKFYFLEMNTRLQVEHPVTEEVTGIDLVKRQIEIASTGKLNLQQKDIIFFGHAIECRINAEDPSKDFLPSAGTIKTYNQPSGPGTRVDSCVFQGCKIPPYYDSLVAKLICHGRDRASAISRLKRSLDEFVIEGVSTTIDLHKKILRNEDFINSKYDVNWLSKTKFY